MPSKKIVGLGGGSLFFHRVLPDLVINPELSGSEIVLYDIDLEKAERMATMCRRLALQALLVDEMVILPEKAQAMLEELFNASRYLLPQFQF
ncbi:MAG: hypothetical protein WC975_08490 [Phycisphaerae bacterium]